jgi:hypothetical protein
VHSTTGRTPAAWAWRTAIPPQPRVAQPGRASIIVAFDRHELSGTAGKAEKLDHFQIQGTAFGLGWLVRALLSVLQSGWTWLRSIPRYRFSDSASSGMDRPPSSVIDRRRSAIHILIGVAQRRNTRAELFRYFPRCKNFVVIRMGSGIQHAFNRSDPSLRAKSKDNRIILVVPIGDIGLTAVTVSGPEPHGDSSRSGGCSNQHPRTRRSSSSSRFALLMD